MQVEWLLGADGPNSLVRRTVAAPFAREDLSIATGFYVHGCTSSNIAIAFEDEPAGYLWSFPRPDHLAVGACAQADETRPATLLAIVSGWLERNVAPGLRLEKYSWPIPSLSARALDRETPSGPGWLLLGDAGGMVDPITREGIYFALASGDAAAHSLEAGQQAQHVYDELIRDTVHAGTAPRRSPEGAVLQPAVHVAPDRGATSQRRHSQRDARPHRRHAAIPRPPAAAPPDR